MENNLKFYNQEGKEVNLIERPAGWAVDVGKGTNEEVDTLLRLLKQFEPIKLTARINFEALSNIDFSKSSTEPPTLTEAVEPNTK